jgi:hypothetical protein
VNRAAFVLSVLIAVAIAPPLSAQRMPDGHPDLNGLWNSTTVNGPHIPSEDPAVTNLPSRDGSLVNYERDGALLRRADPNRPLYKPEFWTKVQELDQNGNEADPSYGCMPAGVPRMGPPDKIVQTEKEILFLYVAPAARGWGDAYRVIPMDGRKHTPLDDIDGTWKGESIGRWDGDTLVVDTIGFNGRTRLDTIGHPNSAKMHVVEKYTRTDLGHIQYEMTIDDPVTYTKPWKNVRTFTLRPDWEIMEYSCEENNKDFFEGHIKATQDPNNASGVK